MHVSVKALPLEVMPLNTLMLCLLARSLSPRVSVFSHEQKADCYVVSKSQSPTCMPLGAKGIATGSKDATRGSWPYY